jgi:predicted NBD/HSP70 family sugar kinase
MSADSGQTGGIDLGGTKIEARLFAADWTVRESRRLPTPRDSYAELLDALGGQMAWLTAVSGDAALPIGIGSAGIADAETGVMLTSNLPATGRPLAADLARRLGRPVAFVNDCRAFTLSEARMGAGRGFRSVAGLVLGTGVGGGHAVDGALVQGMNGTGGEYGHVAVSAAMATRHALPLLHCGCGRIGCYETLISGPGMGRLALHLTGQAATPAELGGSDRPEARRVMSVWAELVAEMIHMLVLCADPDCIVLGGGLSNIPDLPAILARAASPGLLPGTRLPAIRLAEGGDSSGARGAAMAARPQPTGGAA